MVPQFKNTPQDALKLYRQNGYHIEYDLVDDSIIDPLIEEAYRLSTLQNTGFRPLMMPHRESALFMRFLQHEKVIHIMQELIHGKISGLQSEFFFMKPGTCGFSAHQDNFYVEAESDSFASAWTAFTDVSEYNGGLYVYPGSHKFGKLPVRKFDKKAYEGQDPNANDQETIVPEDCLKIFPEIPKGATLFLHSEVVHGSAPNQSSNFRYALLNTYLREGASFRPGHHARRSEVEVMRQA